MSNAPFEVIDHTADVGIVARGRDGRELFANAALGMLSFMLDVERVRPQTARRVAAEASDLEGLLVAWLNELNYLYTGEGFAACRFDIEELTDACIAATVWGEPADPARHHPRLDIKAATYHQLRIERGREWRARVIFDI